MLVYIEKLEEEEEEAEGGAGGMCRHPMAAGHVCNQINLHSGPVQVNNLL